MDKSGNDDAPSVGIDLGTTYSCVAVWKHDRIEIIPNDQGNRTTPSCVAFVDAERLIGEGAKNQAATNPANTIFDAKRLIGRRFSDTQVQNDKKLWPFKVIEGAKDTPKIVVSYKGQAKEFSAEDISSIVLRKMKEISEVYVGKPVNKAVITVPAFFNDSQRQATKDAGAAAGLNVIRMINEPTAAAIAYGLEPNKMENKKKHVLVFDLGGGTFDVSVSTIVEGGVFEVKAIGGDTHLGGQDFDNRMVDHCVREFERKWNKDVTGDKKALGRLRCACEKAKRILSSDTQTSIELDCLHEGIDFSMRFSRSKFEELNRGYFDKCINILEACLSDAKIDISWISDVILVGGSTRIPKIQSMLKELFYWKELYKSLNPDEAVAYGAAVMAAKLSGNNDGRCRDLVLLDVTPLSLGVEEREHLFSVVIPRNTPIPVKNSKVYRTLRDNQSFFRINVYQGERARSVDNHLCGTFQVSGIPLAPRGFVAVNICFEIDVSGILMVTALTRTKMKKLTIANEKGRLLSGDEIEKMLIDAHKYKNEDLEFKKKSDAFKVLENHVRNMRSKMVCWYSSKKLKEMEHAFANATKWMEQNQAASVDKVQGMKEYQESI